MLDSKLAELLADPSRTLTQLMPIVRIEDNTHGAQLIEIYKPKGRMEADSFLAAALNSFDDGCWFDDSGAGLSKFLPDEFAIQSSSLDDLKMAFENKIDGFLIGEHSVIKNESSNCCYKVLDQWNRKVYVIKQKEDGLVAFCFGTSD